MKNRKQPLRVPAQRKKAAASLPAKLLKDLRGLINEARQSVAQQVNSALVMMYWQVGKRIREDILKEKRAQYGQEIVAAVGRQLELEFGRGYSVRNLWYMVRFAEVFPDEKIVNALRSQLGWTHFRTIMAINDPLKRDFYAEMCRVERWSTRTLEHKIGHLLYERTAIAKKPEKVIEDSIKSLREEDKVTPDLVFKDPYILDFLGLKNAYAEKDVEAAILREIESFILELGVGFAFVERQKRITVDGDDYYLDLLFYHRKLNRLVAIELKLGDFKPSFKGQMELYLRWLDKHERREGEEPPVGLILCAGKKEETVRLLDMEGSGIKVASYWTEALPQKELEKKLHDAVKRARMYLAEQKNESSDIHQRLPSNRQIGQRKRRK